MAKKSSNPSGERQRVKPDAGVGHSVLSESILKDLEELEKALSSDISELTKLRKFAQRLRTTWAASNSSARLLLKDQCVQTLQQRYPQSVKLMERLAADVGRQSSGQAASLEGAIRSFCAELNQPCTGRFPRLTVAHLIEVSVDASSNRTKVGVLSIQSCDWSKIKPAIEREIARVWDRLLDAVEFRDRLLSIYEEKAAKNLGPTSDVKLTEIFRALRDKKNREDPKAKSGGRLSAYYSDEFSADLSKILKVQLSGDLPLPQLVFSSIRRAEEGFPVVTPGGDVTIYGFVRPRR